MRILDTNGNEIVNPDLSKGYLKSEQLFVMHHEAVAEVPEQSHTEVTATYPNGGRDFDKIVDVEYVPAKEARDEYEDIYRYVLYTPEELEEMNKPKPDDPAVLRTRVDELQAEMDAMQRAYEEGVQSA